MIGLLIYQPIMLRKGLAGLAGHAGLAGQTGI
jgi:hypothetical protein